MAGVGKFGWRDVSGGVIRELSDADVKGMLLSVAWGYYINIYQFISIYINMQLTQRVEAHDNMVVQ